MGYPLNKPSIGSTNWGTSVNDNFTTLDGAGLADFVNPVSITTGTTLTSSAFNKVHSCSGTSADYTVVLPASSGNTGKTITFRGLANVSLSKVVTIDGNASETIDGKPTLALLWDEVLTIMSDGTNWVVLNHKFGNWKSFTATINAVTTNPTKGTNTDKCAWRRIGNWMEVVFFYQQTTAGTAGSGTYKFPVPNSFTMDTNVITANDLSSASNMATIAGYGFSWNKSTGGQWILSVIPYDSTNFALLREADGDFISGSANSMSNANVYYTFRAQVPISGW